MTVDVANAEIKFVFCLVVLGWLLSQKDQFRSEKNPVKRESLVVAVLKLSY